MKKRDGFTLIELLVVVAIITALAALLFPLFAAARERSHLAVCTSNLKQLHTALQLYSQDWDDMLPAAPNGWDLSNTPDPNAADFKTVMKQYAVAAGVWRCPSDTWSLHPSASDADSTYDAVGTSYVWHWQVDPYAMQGVRDTTAWWLVHDIEAWHGGMPEAAQAAAFSHHREHLASLNTLFLDGHVKPYRTDQWADLMAAQAQ